MKELLSTYFDDELSSDQRTAVAEHLAACDECAQELAEFGRLSALAEGLARPESSAQIWPAIEQQLDVECGGRHGRAASADRLPLATMRLLLLGLSAAAAILVAAGWFGYRAWLEHESHHLASVFGKYLDEFHRDPLAAQQLLLAHYPGQIVNPELAAESLGYRPAVASGLPEGYSVETTCVMKMPCCTCVKCLCKRKDGSAIAIFEHDDEETKEWFGNRPETSALCGGVRCNLVELEGGIAASWKRGTRHLTVIGAQDTEEIDRLVFWFEDRTPSEPHQ